MIHMHGWIELCIPEDDENGVDWRLANATYEENITTLRDKIIASEWHDTKCGVYPMNGQYVFIIHAVFNSNSQQLLEIRHVIKGIATVFQDSMGLVHECEVAENIDDTYKVAVFDQGGVNYKYDPFLTSIV